MTKRGERWRDGRAGGGHRGWGTVCQSRELETSAVVWLLLFPLLPHVLSYTQQRYELGHKRGSSRLWGWWYICPLLWKKDGGQSLLLLRFQIIWFKLMAEPDWIPHNITQSRRKVTLYLFIYLSGGGKSCQSVVCVSSALQFFRILFFFFQSCWWQMEEWCWTVTVPWRLFPNNYAQPSLCPPVCRSCVCLMCTCTVKTATGARAVLQSGSTGDRV